MNTPKRFPKKTNSINENSETDNDPLTDTAMIDFASVLDDFLDEEVVDQQGTTIGTLACYWNSVSGLLMFLGIKLKGEQRVRVVPGRRSQVDDRHACIRLGFEAEDIASAPYLDCDTDLNPPFERRIYEHFHFGEAQPHDGLRYFARQS
jgi:hypothetical protein